MRIDPALEEQLAEADASSKSLAVWGTLQTPLGKRDLSPTDVGELAHRIVARAEEATGDRAKAVQVYENLNTFSLDATPRLIRNLAMQPEVASLGAALRKESMAIEPVPTTPEEKAKVRAVRRRHSRRR